MIGLVLFSFFLMACSPEQPTPVAPAGKTTDFEDLFDLFNTSQQEDDAQDELASDGWPDDDPAEEAEKVVLDSTLFQAACLEIEASLLRLIPISFKYSKWEDGKIGTASISGSSIEFHGYSESGKFILYGRIHTFDSYGRGGTVYVRPVDSSDSPGQSFLVETKHVIELDRRGKRLVSLHSEFAAMELAFLAEIKDALVGALQLALSTSLNNPDTYTYVEGCIADQDPDGCVHNNRLNSSYFYVEVEKQIATWEFYGYSPGAKTNGSAISGTLSDIKITPDATHVEGYLVVSRDVGQGTPFSRPDDKVVGDDVGIEGFGAYQYPVGIDLTFSQGEAKGTFRIEVRQIDPPFYMNWIEWSDGIDPNRWTLEELKVATKTPLRWSKWSQL